MRRTARITDIRPVITDTVVGTRRQMQHLAENPHTRAITRIARVGPDTVAMTVLRVEPLPRRRRPRLPFRLAYAGPRPTRRGLRTTAWVLGSIGALLTAGWVTYAVYGEQINTAVKTVGMAVAAILSVAAIAWVVSLTTGRCPGIHCPGCPCGR